MTTRRTHISTKLALGAALVAAAVTLTARPARAACGWVQQPGWTTWFEGAHDGSTIVQPAIEGSIIGELLTELFGGPTYSHALSVDWDTGERWSHQYADFLSPILTQDNCNWPIVPDVLQNMWPGYLSVNRAQGRRHGEYIGVETSCPVTTSTVRYNTAALFGAHSTSTYNTCSGLLKHKCGATATPHDINGTWVTSALAKIFYQRIHDKAYDACLEKDPAWPFYNSLFCGSYASVCNRAGWQVANRIVLNVNTNADLRGSWSTYYPGAGNHASPGALAAAYGVTGAAFIMENTSRFEWVCDNPNYHEP